MSRAYLYRGETATLRVVALSQGRPMPITSDIEIELEVRTTSMGRVLVKNTAGDFDMSAAADGIILCPLSADDTRQLTPGRATINITIRRDGGVSMGATSDIDILRPSSMPSPNNNRLIPMDVVISDAPVEIVLDFIGSEPSLKTINGESLKGEGDINTHLHYATTVDDLPSNVPDGDEGIVSINEVAITDDLASFFRTHGSHDGYMFEALDLDIRAINFSWRDNRFPEGFSFSAFALTSPVAAVSINISGKYVEAFTRIGGGMTYFDWNITTTDPSKAAEEVQAALAAVVAEAASQQTTMNLFCESISLDEYSAIEITWNRSADLSKYVRVGGEWQQQPRFAEASADHILPITADKSTILMRNLGGGYRDYLANFEGSIYPVVIGNNGYNVNDLYVSISDEQVSNYFVQNWEYLLDQGSMPPQTLHIGFGWINTGTFQLRLASWRRNTDGSLWAEYSASPAVTNYQIFSDVDVAIFIDANANPQAQISSVYVGEEMVSIGPYYNPRKLPELDDATYVSFSGETTIDNVADLKNLFKTLVNADMMLPLSLEVEIPGASMGAHFTVRLDNLAKEPGSNRTWAKYSAKQVYNVSGESCAYIEVTLGWRSTSSIVIGGQYYGFTKNI